MRNNLPCKNIIPKGRKKNGAIFSLKKLLVKSDHLPLESLFSILVGFLFIDVKDCLLDEVLFDFDCPFFFPLSLFVFFLLSDLLFQTFDDVFEAAFDTSVVYS
jgi:hypothetical protein